MLTALASVMSPGDGEDAGKHGDEEAIGAAAQIADPAGTFYRFSMAHSILRRVRGTRTEEEEA
jgi:hypothetical protein